jgi:hypothetical protein
MPSPFPCPLPQRATPRTRRARALLRWENPAARTPPPRPQVGSLLGSGMNSHTHTHARAHTPAKLTTLLSLDTHVTARACRRSGLDRRHSCRRRRQPLQPRAQQLRGALVRNTSAAAAACSSLLAAAVATSRAPDKQRRSPRPWLRRPVIITSPTSPLFRATVYTCTSSGRRAAAAASPSKHGCNRSVAAAAAATAPSSAANAGAAAGCGRPRPRPRALPLLLLLLRYLLRHTAAWPGPRVVILLALASPRRGALHD